MNVHCTWVDVNMDMRMDVVHTCITDLTTLTAVSYILVQMKMKLEKAMNVKK